MELLGCFKIVPDLELLTPADWVSPDGQTVETDFVRTVWNCYDESGLELMLRAAGSGAALSALTIGKRNCEPYLKTLYALGFAHAVRVDCSADLRFAPGFVADCIAGYVRTQARASFVVTGLQSADGANGETPLLLAEKLGWRCRTQVTDFQLLDEQTLAVQYLTEEGTVAERLTAPAVLAVGNVPRTFLRVPTLKAKLTLGKQPITVLPPEELGVGSHQETAQLCALTVPNTGRNAVRLEGTVEEQVEEFYSRFWKEWQKK